MQLFDNKYFIQKIELTGLIRKYGEPLYVYDIEKITSQYKRISEAFKDSDTSFNFACKSLNNINIINNICKLGAGVDAVSINEVKLALKAGCNPKKIIFTPSGVSFAEIEEAVDLCVNINIDNLDTLKKFGEKYGSNIPVGIRINPHIMAGGNIKISTGHKDSKFGISASQVNEIKSIASAYKIKIAGLHMHTGSDILEVEAFIKGAEVMYNTAMNFKELEFLDFGSGFKVAYKENDVVTDIEKLGKDLTESFNNFCKDYGKKLKLIFEPGKFLVSEAGYFLARVNTVKQTPSTTFAAMNTGQNHFLRPMFYDAYHRIINISNPSGNTNKYNVVGYICETDNFGINRKISEIRQDDILAFLNAGAYCFTMANNYNGRLRPAEVMIKNGKDYLIRKQETFEDLISKQIIIED